MPQERDIIFGKVVAANKFASGDQIRECLKIQEDTGKNLSEVMVEKGYLTRAQAYQALARVMAQELKGQTVSGCVAGDFIGLTPTGALLKGKREDSAKDIMLKVLSPALTSDDNFRNAYFEAVKIYGKVKHPNIWGIIGMTKREDAVVVVLPAFTGVSLAEVMKTRGHLPPAEALSVVKQVAQALAAAHQSGAAHGSVRPENIFVTSNRNVLLGHFGQSVPPANENKITAWSEHFGMPYFLAPEQIRGERGGMPADIFALGVLYYWLLSGQYPFAGKTPEEIVRRTLQGMFPTLKEAGVSVPDKTAMLLEQMLAHQGVARPSIAEILPELNDVPTLIQQTPKGEKEDMSLQEDDQPEYEPVAPRQVYSEAIAENEIDAVLAARGISLAPKRKRSNLVPRLIGAIVVVILIVVGVIYFGSSSQPQSENGTPENETTNDQEQGKNKISTSNPPQAALEAARKFHTSNPDKIIEAIDRYNQVAKKFPAATQCGEALSLVANLRLRHTGIIRDTKLGPFLQASSQAISDNNYNKALSSLNSARTFLKSYPDYCYEPALLQELDGKASQIKIQNKSYLTKIYDQLRVYVDDGKKVDALQLCDTMRKQSLPDYYGMIDQLKNNVENNVDLPLMLDALNIVPGKNQRDRDPSALATFETSPAYMAFWKKFQAYLQQRRFQEAADCANKFTSTPVGEEFKTYARRDAELAGILYKALSGATAKMETYSGSVKLDNGKTYEVLGVEVRENSVFEDPEKSSGSKVNIPVAVISWKDSEAKENSTKEDIAMLAPSDLVKWGGDNLTSDEKNIARAGLELCSGNLEEANNYFSKSPLHVVSVFYLIKLSRMVPSAAPVETPAPKTTSLFPDDEVDATAEKEATDLVERWRAAINAKNEASALTFAQKLFSNYIRTQALRKVGDELDLQMNRLLATKCPADMVYVAGGRYRLQNVPDLSENIPAFCIDAFEFPNRMDAEPGANIAYMDAVSACKLVGKNLCSEYQWERACVGAARNSYPYGAAYASGVCSFDKKAGPMPLGSKMQCATANKIFDMVGNVSEWTSTLVPENKTQQQRVVRGGAFNAEKPEEVNCYTRSVEFEALTNPAVGFRCCKEAKK